MQSSEHDHSYADMTRARLFASPAAMRIVTTSMFCDSFERVPGNIVLDIDDTGGTVNGGQDLALYNAHYDAYCSSSPSTYRDGTGKPVLSLPRPGKRPSGKDAPRVLRHVIRRIRHNGPRVGIAVRRDGWYGSPNVMDLLEDQGCGYILGLPGTPG